MPTASAAATATAFVQSPGRVAACCPICCGEGRLKLEVRGYPIHGCTNCGHHFLGIELDEQHASKVYDDRYFNGSPEGYPNYFAEGATLRLQGRWYGNMLRRFAPAGTLLDAGSAAGFLLKGFEDAGWAGTGIEPNPAMVQFARRQLGVDVRLGTLEQWKLKEPFAAIAMIQVISHLFDLRRALEVVSAVTKPGSLWLIETWDRESFTARLAGSKWHEYNPPSVVQWFSREGLTYLAEQYGFQSLATGRPDKRINVDHAASVLSQDKGLMSSVARAGLKVLPRDLSLPYPGNDVFWSLFRRVR